MKIGVCAKFTPDTDTRVKLRADNGGIDPAGIKWVVSPYDALALEEGLRLKEKHGGEVVSFTVGGDETVALLKGTVLALGVTKAVLVSDPAVATTDALGIARILAAAAKAEGVEVLFFGKQAIDGDNGQVGSMVAELLGWPQVSRVSELTVEGTAFKAVRAVDGGQKELVSGALPAVFTADMGLNTPRFPKLPDIVKAKSKTVETRDLAALGLSAADIAPAVQHTSYGLPPSRPKGRVLQGDADTQVAELVRLLREEAKVL
ncbi:MAG: electron transfer flavoprotein subunit beta/FixA family protein [Deltaproteobacteria bacterium]|nr:electron transfer flavoprotein subunit beta/FixA family protein [Deltaproteobacteria bacterium]